jgi:hypothetical protein
MRAFRIASVCAAVLSGAVAAQAVPPLSSDVIFLRKDCTTAPDPGRCLQTMTDVASWLWGPLGPREPADGDPVLVDVGPGDFEALHCPSGTDRGYTTFRGAGREHSRISGQVLTNVGVLSLGCVGLAFEDLGVDHGVMMLGAGSSTWTGVDLAGGWVDTSCGGAAGDAPAGRHQLFASRIMDDAIALISECSDLQIYGSDVGVVNETPVSDVTAVKVGHRATVGVFGSTVRVVTGAAVHGTGVVVGPNSGGSTGYGRFEMSGGIVSIATGGDATGIRVDRGSGGTATARTPDTAFALNGPGTKTRVVEATQDAGGVEAPFVWEAGVHPPTSGNETSALESLHGQDLFVEVDCGDAQGGCDGGAEPHLMIFSDSCTSGAASGGWFDLVTGMCR